MYKIAGKWFNFGSGRDCSSPPEEIFDPAFYKDHPPQITKLEASDFEFGRVSKEDFLDKIRPTIRAYARQGIRKPKEVSRALNRAAIKTACGRTWTPRLVWFLLKYLFEK